MKNMNTIAAIDIGSNAVRFLISNIEEDSDKKCRKVAFLRVPVRLGEDAFTSGTISEERRARLCEAMQSFDHLMKAFGVRDYRACANSRALRNGPEVLAEIKEKSNIDVGNNLRRKRGRNNLRAGAALHSLGGRRRRKELASRRRRRRQHGSGRLRRSGGRGIALLPARNGTPSQQSRIERRKRRLQSRAAAKSSGKYSIQRIIASGGNINKAQKLLNKREGEPVSYIELKMLYDMLKKMTFEERIKNFKLNPYAPTSSYRR